MKLGKHCYAITGLAHSELMSVNCGFIVGENETLLIDSGYSAECCPTIEGYAKAIGGSNKITKLVLLENHLDHKGNAAYFKEKYGVTIFGWANTGFTDELAQKVLEYKRTLLNEEPARQNNDEAEFCYRNMKKIGVDTAIDKPTHIDVTGLDVTVYPTPGHSAANLILYEANDKVLYTADTITTRYLPYAEYSNTELWNTWLTALDLIATLDVEYLVPGHGPVITRAEIPAELKRHRKIIVDLLEAEKNKPAE